MNSSYLVIARRYRPQTFSDVIGQNSIVKTLTNAIQSDRVSHAYLFSGSKGTGKTTLARLFAKALNCSSPLPTGEPCNTCTACVEITECRSLDVQEIDGASHRGIDHIRTLTEGASYLPAVGRYKIYLIDEVHMLTKEAFNALLKTLEEPPPTVKFFLATTEPHKIPPTIISRCQRFNLRRLSEIDIVTKLTRITEEMKITADKQALSRLAGYADGGLRDAESLLDQVITFSDGHIAEQLVEEVLGLVPFDWFIQIDQAIQSADISVAYTLSDRIFHEGKDIAHVIDDLTNHYRSILLYQLKITQALDPAKEQALQETALHITQEQTLEIFNLLTEAQKNLRTTSSQRFLLEWLLINIIRIKQTIPIPLIVRKLAELNPNKPEKWDSDEAKAERITRSKERPDCNMDPLSIVESRDLSLTSKTNSSVCLDIKTPLESYNKPFSQKTTPYTSETQQIDKKQSEPKKKQKKASIPAEKVSKKAATPSIQTAPEKNLDLETLTEKQLQSRNENLIQFAAVELGATINKTQN